MAPSKCTTLAVASVFIASGICQPLMMTACKVAGLADPHAQIYMFFYYLGPSAIILSLMRRPTNPNDNNDDQSVSDKHAPAGAPSRAAILKACAIASFDLLSQTLNYRGASLAGSTIFAVIYSSVTIWTALWSRILLNRSLSWSQWCAVGIVFGGLCVTALNSADLGPNVKHGALLVLMGSSMHGGAYVFSERLMITTADNHDGLSVQQNAAIQSLFATIALGLWQLVYTLPHWETVIAEPVQRANTSLTHACLLLFGFAFANLIHSLTFYHTLKHYPGGSTSAGVMKGLQAVLVFVATHFLFCGRVGGSEMCFTIPKFISLVTVVMGVMLFGCTTEYHPQPDLQNGAYTEIKAEVEEEDASTENDESTINTDGPFETDSWRFVPPSNIV